LKGSISTDNGLTMGSAFEIADHGSSPGKEILSSSRHNNTHRNKVLTSKQ
jgi:hypothetical protein